MIFRYFNVQDKNIWKILPFSALIMNLENSKVILADRRKVGSKFSYSSQIVRLRHNRRGVWRIHRLTVKTCKKKKTMPKFTKLTSVEMKHVLTKLMYQMVCIGEMHFKVAWQGPPGYEGVGRGLWRPLIWGLSSSTPSTLHYFNIRVIILGLQYFAVFQHDGRCVLFLVNTLLRF